MNLIAPIDGNYVLDMGSPDAQEYIISIVRELVTNYPIDGINWDDEINGTGYNQGYGFPAYSQTDYTNSGLARYRRNTGYVGTPSATDSAYSDYRRRFKNELMARSQAEIQSIKTNPRQPLWHTSAPLAYGTAPSTCDFTPSTPYLYYCDWAGMLRNGWIDAAIPQVYRSQSTSASNFRGWCDRSAACWQYERKIFIGLGAYLNTKTNTVTQLQYAFGDGLQGCATYSYGVPSSDGGDWWSYAATNIYTNVATVPTMPWRDPATATNGMMWGRVIDVSTGAGVDDATVTITGGPAVQTDGNGYYVGTLIPAVPGGTLYSTTASKTGLVAQTISDATVLPGDIVRYDFLLPPVPPPVVAAWGDNTFGQIDLPEVVTNAVAVSAGEWHTLALRPNGEVVGWGDNSSGQCNPPPFSNIVAIAAGGYHNLAIRISGEVIAWGDDDYGQINVPADLGQVITIAAGSWHSVARRTNGTVVIWGDNSYGQLNQPPGLTNVIAVAAGGNHTLALKADGTVVAWGENTDAEGKIAGQCVVPADLNNVVAVAAGAYHSLALRADGTVVAWGDNSQGQASVPPGLINVVAVAGGGAHSVALLADGSVIAWGSDWNSQCDVPADLPPATQVAAGSYHTAVLLESTLRAPVLTAPSKQGSQFTALVQTSVLKSYALEYADSVTSTNWTPVSTNIGDGTVQMFVDPAATTTSRFYRVRQW